MKWIGLTGGLATGKSTVADILKKDGWTVINADHLARVAVQKGSPGLRQVVQVFGPDVLGADGDLDRRALGRLVFGQPKNLDQLEAIIHPIVRRLADEERIKAQRAGVRLAFYDVPLLFEKKMQKMFDKIAVVACSPENQKRRALERDKLSPDEIAKRLASQLPLKEKIKGADVVIQNDGSLEDLRAAVQAALPLLTQ